jgi:hypothetical protein
VSSAGVADAFRDRADNHIAEIYTPNLLGDVGIETVGEGGHAAIFSPIGLKGEAAKRSENAKVATGFEVCQKAQKEKPFQGPF